MLVRLETSAIPLCTAVLIWVVCPGPGLALDWERQSGFERAPLSTETGSESGFTLVSAEQSGIEFINSLSDSKAGKNQILLNGSGVAAGDYDGDGRCDLYFCSLTGSNALYRNRGDWRFDEVAQSVGVDCSGQYSTGASFVDIDGDRDLDLLVTATGRGTRLFLNRDGQEFIEAEESGLSQSQAATTMALGDADGDGDLDLYVANYRSSTLLGGNPSRLNREDVEVGADGQIKEFGEADFFYENTGDARFSVWAWHGGRFQDAEGRALESAPRDWGLSVCFRDINQDGAADLYVCNDFASPDRIWISAGSGKFREFSPGLLRNAPLFSMGIDFADLDRDGEDDFLVLGMLERDHVRRMQHAVPPKPVSESCGTIGLRQQFERNVLQWNRGDGSYAEIANFSGLAATGRSWSPVFLDVDLDAYEDLLITTGHWFNNQDMDAAESNFSPGRLPSGDFTKKLADRFRLLLPNLALRNLGNLKFVEAPEWGFDAVGVSHGMAVADLDEDGDLDVAVNHLNSVAGVYRNQATASRIAVRLQGRAPNTEGIGARIRLIPAHPSKTLPIQQQEMMKGGRYLSSDEALRVFAVPDVQEEYSLEVLWPQGRRSRLSRVRADHVYKIKEEDAPAFPVAPEAAAVTSLFADVSSLLKGHFHQDAGYDDFLSQPLLPRRLSRLGPGVTWSDLDGNGFDELLIGSGAGGEMAVFINDGKNPLMRARQPPFNRPVTEDQSTILAWTSQQETSTLLIGATHYESGQAADHPIRVLDLVKRTANAALPAQEDSVGPLAMGDIDGDGDLDLFIGGRVLPGRYPKPATSRLFRFEEDGFVEDRNNNTLLKDIGLVSSALLTDLDGNGFPDLVLACEWGMIRVFLNQSGQLSESTRSLGLDLYSGFWNGIASGDLNGDGRLDLIATNWGENSQYRASPNLPQLLYYGDFSGNSVIDLVEAYTESGTGRTLPERGLFALSDQMPAIRPRVRTHRRYGESDLAEILGDILQRAGEVKATELRSMAFINEGVRFKAVPLPDQAQWAPAFGVVVVDFDGDGDEDVFLAQNHYSVGGTNSRSDAGRGLLLRGDGAGGLEPMGGEASGIRILGEQRGAAWSDFNGDGRADLAVAQNCAATRLFMNQGAVPGLRVRLAGVPANPRAIGARVALQFAAGSGPVRENQSGSGYWSQNSIVQVLGVPQWPVAIKVYWPGGRTTQTPMPLTAREIAIDYHGRLRVIR